MITDSHKIGGQVSDLENDLRVFSKSFSDFLQHYDKNVRTAKSNHSLLSQEVLWVKRSVNEIGQTLGSSNSALDSVQGSVEKLSDSVAILSQADYILEERMRSNENRTEVYAATLNGEIMKLKASSVNPMDVKELVKDLQVCMAISTQQHRYNEL